jgi:hypothetical protein
MAHGTTYMCAGMDFKFQVLEFGIFGTNRRKCQNIGIKIFYFGTFFFKIVKGGDPYQSQKKFIRT